MDECISSNSVGTHEVFNFVLQIILNLFTQLLLQVLEIMVWIKIYHLMLLQNQKILKC